MSVRAERVPNETLRGVRRGLNLSQDEFAARLRAAGEELGEPNEATKRLVQRWESGESRTARPVYRRALERVTARPYRELGFKESARAPDADADRGTLLETGAGPLLTRHVLINPADRRPASDNHRAVAGEHVARLRARTIRHRKLDEHLGGADTYRLYALDLEETAALIRHGSYSGGTGRQLTALYAEQAQQAGWAAFDAGMHERAEHLYLASLDAARTASDVALAGNAYALLGYQQNQTGHDSVDTAAEAYRQAGQDAPTGARVLFAQRQAWAHAMAGQISATQAALELAEGHLRESDGRPVPDWAVWADEREQRIIEGRSWAVLRRPLRAVPILESVLAEYEDHHARDKALYLMWLAGAYVDAGELEAAAHAADRALDLAENVASARPARRAAEVMRQLQPYKAVPAVRDLLDRANSG
jgi:DNA-binding transcriptional regulator YiaG